MKEGPFKKKRPAQHAASAASPRCTSRLGCAARRPATAHVETASLSKCFELARALRQLLPRRIWHRETSPHRRRYASHLPRGPPRVDSIHSQ